MASGLNVPPPAPFPIYSSLYDAATRWPTWLRSFNLYISASAVTDDSQQRGLLQYLGGDDLQQLVPQLSGTGTTLDDLAKAVQKELDSHQNATLLRYQFRMLSQRPDEAMEAFATRLKDAVKRCGFPDEPARNMAVLDQLIIGGKSEPLRRKLLETESLDVDKAVKAARAYEASISHTQALRDGSLGSNSSSSSTHLALELNTTSNARRSTGPGTRSGTTNARSSESASAHSVTRDTTRSVSSVTRVPTHAREDHSTRFVASGEQDSDSSVHCYRCGKPGHATCNAAQGKFCSSCGKPNHFAAACRSSNRAQRPQRNRQVAVSTQPAAPSSTQTGHAVAELTLQSALPTDVPPQSGRSTASSPLEHELFTTPSSLSEPVDADNARRTVEVEGRALTVLIDSGASHNIINTDDLRTVAPHATVTPTDLQIFTYGATQPLALRGTTSLSVTAAHRTVSANFAIVDAAPRTTSLLGRDTAAELGLLHLVNTLSGPIPNLPPDLVDFRDRFEGLGCIRDVTAHIHVRPDARPVVHTSSRVPAHLHEATLQELTTQLQLGIIEPATGPTPWVARMVVVSKRNTKQVRITQDFRDVNAVSERERHPIPTLQELTADMADARFFSELDLNKAFHQIDLDEKSRQFAVFSTPLGLMRCKRLAMGLTSAAEILQRTMDKVLAGLPGVRGVHDNIFIYGSSLEEHDARLRSCLQRLRTFNVTLNPAKCQFRKSALTFMSTTYTPHGICAADRHKQAVADFKPPTTSQEVRSFLGLVNFLRHYIPNMATISEPLRKLTKKGQPWHWSEAEQASFQALKAAIRSDKLLAYFDRSRPTHLLVDASPVGLGAILCQEDTSTHLRPVAFASRSLSPTEQRYSQTEREALAIKYGCLHFSHYLCGDPMFTIHTDHKPLLQLFAPSSRPPPRIERMALRIQHLSFQLQYDPGPENPADIFSRQPSPMPDYPNIGAEEDQAYIAAMALAAVPNALSMSELQKATEEDNTLQAVLSSLRSGNWHPQSREVRPYFSQRHELSEADGLLLRSQRLVIPTKLRGRTLELAHAGHQGQTRTKQRLYSKVWWPGMSTEADTLCRQCRPCQATTTTPNIRLPSTPTPPSARPWSRLFIDLYGPIPGGQHVFVIIDQMSRFPVTHVFNSTPSAANVTSVLRSVFCIFGTPDEIVSDNGPQFRAEHFRSFLTLWAVKHRTTPPLWPQANGAVERINSTIGKTLRTAKLDGRDVREALDTWLLAYRTTPHPATGVPPATLVFGRTIRDTIPTIQDRSDPLNWEAISAREHDFRRKTCEAANSLRNATSNPTQLRVGQQVLRKNEDATHKLDPQWDPNPWTVTESTPATVTIQNPITSQVTTRHSSFVKPIIVVTPPETDDTTPQPSPSDQVSSPEEPTTLPDVAIPQPAEADATSPTDSIAQRSHPRAAKDKATPETPQARRKRRRNRRKSAMSK